LRLSLRVQPVLSGVTVDLFQPNLDPSSSIPADVLHQVAITFGLTVADVRVDARDIATWVGADDGLLHGIAQRRRLAPTRAATYLEDLRTALSAS
jgi:hypothetical protein